MRLTALAAESGCELSTVSRQVASLVDSGYVERQPDPADGRAFLLAATGLAQARYAEQVRMREGEIARMLADWSSEDLSQLGILLTRFTDDLEKHQWRLTAHSLVPEQHSTAIDKEEDRS
jgi:DNA-binding MarR family transcriptional regulator